MLYGEINKCKVSTFFKEIPKELIDEHKKQTVNQFAYSMNIPRKAPETHHDFSYKPVTPPSPKPIQTAFKVGMTVRHKVFGEGTVTAVTPMSSDTMLEVAFVSAGKKKLMANYAKLEVL